MAKNKITNEDMEALARKYHNTSKDEIAKVRSELDEVFGDKIEKSVKATINNPEIRSIYIWKLKDRLHNALLLSVNQSNKWTKNDINNFFNQEEAKLRKEQKKIQKEARSNKELETAKEAKEMAKITEEAEDSSLCEQSEIIQEMIQKTEDNKIAKEINEIEEVKSENIANIYKSETTLGREFYSPYKPRDYQIWRIKIIEPILEKYSDMIGGIKSWEAIDHDKLDQISKILIAAATWSGKTNFQAEVLNIINRRKKIDNDYSPIRILVIANLIWTIRQSEKSLLWDDNKSWVISENLINKLNILRYDHHNKKEYQKIWTSESQKNVIRFACSDTANLVDILDNENIPNFDVIVVEEVHNFWPDVLKALNNIVKKSNQSLWYPVLQIWSTATPTSKTISYFWNPVIEFPLYEYLWSWYWPKDILYKIILNEDQDKMVRDVSHVLWNIESIKDYKDKKNKFNELTKDIKDKLIIYDQNMLIWYICDNIIKPETKTVLYCKSIKKANYINDLINKYLGIDVSQAYHSDSKSWVFEDFISWKYNTMVVVDKFSEAVDIPEIENGIILDKRWWYVDFIQTIGRLMRWEKCHIYDFSGSILQLLWTFELHQKTIESLEKNNKSWKNRNQRFDIESNLTFSPQEYNIDFVSIMQKYFLIKKELLRFQWTAEQIRSNYIKWEIKKENLTDKEYPTFAAERNKNREKYWFLIPLTRRVFIEILEWDDIEIDIERKWLDYVISLLEWNEYIDRKRANVEDYKELYKNEILTRTDLENIMFYRTKATSTFEKINKINDSNINNFLIHKNPAALCNAILGKISAPIDEIISKLEWIEYIENIYINGDKYKELIKSWILSINIFDNTNYTKSADKRNSDKELTSKYGKMHRSMNEVSRVLWLESYKITNIKNALLWKIDQIVKDASMEDIILLCKQWKIKSEHIRKRNEYSYFANERNKSNSHILFLELPTTITSIIIMLNKYITKNNILDKENQLVKIEGIDWVKNFLFWEEKIIIKGSKQDIINLWQKWEIKWEDLNSSKWWIELKKLNEFYSKKWWFTIPNSWQWFGVIFWLENINISRKEIEKLINNEIENIDNQKNITIQIGIQKINQNQEKYDIWEYVNWYWRNRYANSLKDLINTPPRNTDIMRPRTPIQTGDLKNMLWWIINRSEYLSNLNSDDHVKFIAKLENILSIPIDKIIKNPENSKWFYFGNRILSWIDKISSKEFENLIIYMMEVVNWLFDEKMIYRQLDPNNKDPKNKKMIWYTQINSKVIQSKFGNDMKKDIIENIKKALEILLKELHDYFKK